MRPSGSSTEVRIDGHYVPPFGTLGLAFDAVVGRHIAKRTLGRLIVAIEAFVEKQYGAQSAPS